MSRGFYLIAIFVLASLFGWEKYSGYIDRKQSKQDIESIHEYYANELKSAFAGKELIAQDVKSMKQLIVTQQKDIESIKEIYSNFKKINSVIKIESSSSVKDFQIPIIKNEITFSDSLIPKDIVNQFYIAKNSKSSYSDEWVDLAFTIGDSLIVDSINVRNKYDAVLGWQKPDKPLKFLRKSVPILEVRSYSPYSEVTFLNNIIVKEESKGSKFINFIKSPPFMLGAGIVGGYFISKKI